MTEPVTSLHYAPNANVVNGLYAPGADGFNLADVSSAAAADALPAGVEGLVWLGDTSGLTASFESTVNAAIGDSKVYGFYLTDEPGPDVSAANLKAELDYIHSVDPGAKTFIMLENNGTPTNPSYSFNPANTDIDLFGIDPYPIRPASEGSEFANGYDYAVIGDAVAAAEAEGIPQSQLVPVYQAFGGGQYTSYTLPTAAQEQTILSTWGQYLPNPAFDYAYSWGTQDGDTALSDDPALQAVFAAHNAGTGTPPPPPDVITPTAAAINATAGTQFSGTVATFADSNTAIAASALAATINWGDSTTTAGTVSGSDGSFTVAGVHTYSAAGSDTVAVTLTEVSPGTATATVDSTASVSSAPPPNPTTMTATDRYGIVGNVPVVTSGSSQTTIGSGVVSQSVSSSVDTVSFTNITSENLQLGSGTMNMNFISPRALTVAGGTGTDVITANSGTNTFTAGTGTLQVTGGSGHNAYQFHVGDGLLTIEDFSKRHDSLIVDKSLQGALEETPDGYGGVMLTFGTAGHGIDLVGVSSFAASNIHFV